MTKETSLLPDWLPKTKTRVPKNIAKQSQGFKQGIVLKTIHQEDNHGFSVSTIFSRYKKTADKWTPISLEIRFNSSHEKKMSLHLKSYERGDFISPIKQGQWFIPSVFLRDEDFGMVSRCKVSDLEEAFAMINQLVDYFCSDHFTTCYLASLNCRSGSEVGCFKCPNQLTCLSNQQ